MDITLKQKSWHMMLPNMLLPMDFFAGSVCVFSFLFFPFFVVECGGGGGIS